jgi:hypothetical protein
VYDTGSASYRWTTAYGWTPALELSVFGVARCSFEAVGVQQQQCQCHMGLRPVAEIARMYNYVVLTAGHLSAGSLSRCWARRQGCFLPSHGSGFRARARVNPCVVASHATL